MKINAEKIIKRQFPRRKLGDYLPSQQATVREGPKVSRLSQVHEPRVGRRIHCLSSGEYRATLLALAHPHIFDVADQRAMAPWAEAHPLDLFSPAPGIVPRPGTRGTAEIWKAVSGGEVPHPMARRSNGDRVVSPLLGDLLVVLHDAARQRWGCVNLSVKTSEVAFETSLNRARLLKDPSGVRRRAQIRAEVEREYFLDHHINTIRFTSDVVPDQLAGALAMMHVARVRTHSHPMRQCEDKWLPAALDTVLNQQPLLAFTVRLAEQYALSPTQASDLLLARLPPHLPALNLNEGLLLDRPWRIEATYKHEWWNPSGLWSSIAWDAA